MLQPAGYTLVKANKGQIAVARKRQVPTWARGMTEEQFMAREIHLEGREHAADGRLTAWVLVPRDEPDTMEFRCACETYRRKALITRPSSPPKEVAAYGIASVFTPPQYRNEGYASHMMRLVHYVLASPDSLPPFPQEWGAPPPSYASVYGDACFSVLYSDVGDFYKQCGPTPDTSGWHIYSPISTMWKFNPKAPSAASATLKKFDFLTEEQCIALWETDSAYIADCLSKTSTSSHTSITFLPNDGVAAFLLHRVHAEAPLNPNHPLKHFGVSIPDNDGPTYATWTLDMDLSTPPVIVVTRLRATPQTLPTLLEALMMEARKLGASAVETWNLPGELADVAVSLGSTTVVRSDHLPALAWYGSGPSGEVEWAFNEKFPWC
ncbi:hypothetical protein K439DRAFT_1640492 [Ramaria rubella]|nr:hypothetical protein K439DRAFT_1640492 [Ramaria rubella]